ncbi:MAG: S9 family peptidase [Gemmatimonadaceae bacterium]
MTPCSPRPSAPRRAIWPATHLALALVLAGAPATAAAQTPAAALPPAADSALRTIFASRTFAGERFGPARWLASGDSYTTLEAASGSGAAGGADIVEYDAATGRRTIKVAARQLTPAGQNAPLSPDDYVWSADGKRLLVFTNTRKVWRDNTRGDYWVLDLATGSLRQLGTGAPEASLMFAKFSPAGDRVAYVRDGDIYVERVDGGAPLRLTSDASRTRVNGMTDWVYEEEFGLRDGFRWSPDGRAIAFWQFDMTGIRDFLLINNTDSLYPFTTPVQYPKAGTTNSGVRVGVVPAAGGAVTWAALSGDAREQYVPWMEWAAPGELVLQQLNRQQNNDALLRVNAATGAASPILVERDSAWLDVVDEMPWVNGGREFLWVSERDGWRHVYAVSRDGQRVRLATPGAYDVTRVAAVDERAGWLYVIASPDNATQRYLYRVSLKSPGAPQRVSPAGAPGTHDYTVSPNGRWALHTYSRFDTPPVTDLVSLPAHANVRTLVRNERLRAAAAAWTRSPVEFITVPVSDGVTLDGWMLKPSTFDPAKKYPLLVHVYGEPASQTVTDRWGGTRMLWHRALAEQGYVVVSVDNRGTPAPKGRAWRKVIHGAIGPLASKEQADAVRTLVSTRSYLDASRVGIWGWSGGGSSTLNAMFRHPAVYAMGMAVAPVADQLLYDTIYQERYVGVPGENAEGFRTGSPINFAEGLRGKLLLVHGTGDDNVHYQGTERLVNRLVTLGKPFDVMVYPNRSHCICEGAGTTLHVYSLLTRYLLANLPAGAR